ncbi:MAG: YncE family protein [Actinomycetota bacterium]
MTKTKLGRLSLRLRAAFVALVVVATMAALVPAFAGPGQVSEIDTGPPIQLAIDASRNLLYVLQVPIKVFDLTTEQLVKTIPYSTSPGEGGERFAVDPVLNRLFVIASPGGCGYGPSHMAVIDLSSGTQVATLTLGQGAHDITVNPQTGRVYVVAGCPSEVTVVDGRSASIVDHIRLAPPLDPYQYGSGITHVAVDPTTNRLYVSFVGSSHVVVVDGTTNAQIDDIYLQSPLMDSGMLAVDSRRHRLFVLINAPNFPTVIAIDTSNDQVLETINLGEGSRPTWGWPQPNGIAVSELTGRVYVNNLAPFDNEFGDPGSLVTIDEATNRIVDRTPIGGYTQSPVVLPDSWRLYLGNGFYGTTVSVISEDAVAPVSTITTPDRSILHSADKIVGTVSDDFSGVKEVDVSLTSATGTSTSKASISCSADLRSCSWQIPAPSIPGAYLVQVQGIDRAGSLEIAGPSTNTPAGPYKSFVVLPG